MYQNPSDNLHLVNSGPFPERDAGGKPTSLIQDGLDYGPDRLQNQSLIQQPTPMELLSWVVRNGGNLDVLQNLQAMQDRFLVADKKNAFNQDLAAFKSENIRISKDKYNAQYKSRYAFCP